MSSQRYRPGVEINFSGGVTKSEFEDPAIFAQAVPFEPAIVNSPTLLNQSIAAVNGTGEENIFVALCKDEAIDASIPQDLFFNNPFIDGTFVLDGCSTTFPIHMKSYIFTISEYSISSQGKKFQQSFLGRDLQNIHNTAVSLIPSEIEGEAQIIAGKVQIDGYFTVSNDLDFAVEISVERPTSNNLNSLQQQEIKRDRKPDLGGKVVIQKELIHPGDHFFFLRPDRFNIYALRPRHPVSNPHKQIKPTVTDYTQMSVITGATAGTVNLFFASDSGNGSTDNLSLANKNVKKVVSTIAITHNHGV